MRYISVFSGIEAASVAWGPLGWEPVAFSEVDDFPSAVLAERFPGVPNLGDITKVDWSEYRGAVELVVGGSPCQSFSIAGNRTGLEGASGLMWEYVRCVREVRPRWFVWENVPGALSSAHGEDFGCLLRSMDELGYGLAWSVLDAQFAGVPQRRRRVFLVGSLGDRRSADVLFEPESLRWDSPSSRAKREALAEGAARCAGFGYKVSQGAGSIGFDYEVSPTLLAGRNDASVLTAKTMLVRCGCAGGGKGALIQDDVSATLSTSNKQTLFQPVCMTDTQANASVENGLCGTISVHSRKDPPVVCDGSSFVVRRLTPCECERLQGLPDDWTLIDWKGKKSPDSRRYKAIGNSMCVPVMRWIGERIEAVEREF